MFGDFARNRVEGMVTTNAMRLLQKAGVPFETAQYEVDEADLSGVHAAQMMGVDAACVFKTLVARGEKRGYVVFCIPVDKEIDLKKAARAAGDKRVELIAVKELLPLTGYVRGGCSPVGMKKKFPTYFDESAARLDTIRVSAGMRGEQLIVNPHALCDFVGGAMADLCREE